MNILVFNSGSSSLKFQLFEAKEDTLTSLLRGNAQSLGSNDTHCEWQYHGKRQSRTITVNDYDAAAQLVLDILENQVDPDHSLLQDIAAVGHRLVHGGDRFSEPIVLNDETLIALEDINQLAPLHNPPALAVARACRERLPAVPMAAVFDTAFFHDLPDYVRTYALPGDLNASTQKIRRYGFHGLAHRYMNERYSQLTNTNTRRVITLQLGHGCSIAAIRNGHPLETSMGFTPLEGLIMATRPGDMDIGIVLYLLENGDVTASELNDSLNYRAGLLGLSGASGDMQELLTLESQGHQAATLAVEAFCHRVRKYVGAYLAVLGGADAIVFGGGIGEHAPEIRRRICQGMTWCDLELDAQTNQESIGKESRISSKNSQIAVYVVPVDEETLIAEDTLEIVRLMI